MAETRVLIMAGGTGGHVFPGLAVAADLQSMGAKIAWLGTQRGIEAELVPANNIPIHFIHVMGVRGKGLVQLLMAPLQIVRAVLEAMQVIRRFRPHCVLGLGGFASGPGGIAAWLMRKPLVIHEQNAVAGTTNAILARFASRVFEAFPQTFAHVKQVSTVGNPVRAAIAALPAPAQRGVGQRDRLRILILGGSLGAKAINEMLPAAIERIEQTVRPHLWHQTGKAHETVVREDYVTRGVDAQVAAFVTDMAEAYAWADLVICRAGALTVSELAAAGVGAIMIPFPYAVDDHQSKNAQWLVSAGAGLAFSQSEMTEQRLAALIEELAGDRARLLSMAEKARRLAQQDAARKVAECCMKLGCMTPGSRERVHD